MTTARTFRLIFITVALFCVLSCATFDTPTDTINPTKDDATGVQKTIATILVSRPGDAQQPGVLFTHQFTLTSMRYYTNPTIDEITVTHDVYFSLFDIIAGTKYPLIAQIMLTIDGNPQPPQRPRYTTYLRHDAFGSNITSNTAAISIDPETAFLIATSSTLAITVTFADKSAWTFPLSQHSSVFVKHTFAN